MQASSLISVKHYDYFPWISSSRVSGVLELTDADVKRKRQTAIYNYKILERPIIAAPGWHLERSLALTRYSSRISRNSVWPPPSLHHSLPSLRSRIYERSPLHRKAAI